MKNSKSRSELSGAQRLFSYEVPAGWIFFSYLLIFLWPLSPASAQIPSLPRTLSPYHPSTRMDSLLSDLPTPGWAEGGLTGAFAFNGNRASNGVYARSTTEQNWVDNTWKNASRRVYKRDTTGAVLEQTTQLWGGNWTNYGRRLFEYTDSRRYKTIQSQSWSSLGWTNSTRDSYQYDSLGNVLEELSETWSGVMWVSSRKSDYWNDETGAPLRVLRQMWGGSSWVNTGKTEYVWANSARRLPQSVTSWYWDGAAWKGSERYLYAYTLQGDCSEKVCQSWDVDSSLWVNYQRSRFSYAGTAVEEYWENWARYNDPPTWEPTIRFQRIYVDERYLDCISEVSQEMTWEGWRDVNKISWRYDADMNRMEILYEHSTGDGGWRPSGRTKFQYGLIVQPEEGDLYVAGERDTIRWKDVWQGKTLDIEFSTDNGTTFQAVAAGVAGDACVFAWDAPKDVSSVECVMRINDGADGEDLAESEQFKTKPYILTKKNPSTGDLIVYDMATDRWGFGNTREEMFPEAWSLQFDYQGNDPFTTVPYPQNSFGGIFGNAKKEDFPDWISFVNAFTAEACYWSQTLGLYSPTAVARWRDWKGPWGGSCFGIALANAFAFARRGVFQDHFRDFPVFGQPIEVAASDGVRSVVNELFTHQYGEPHLTTRVSGWITKTPTETLADLKAMFREEDVPVSVLMFYQNKVETAGHAVLPYALKRIEGASPGSFKLRIWDNSNPHDTTLYILLDSAALNGHGYWNYPTWAGWGGYWRFFLMDSLGGYLRAPTLPGKVGPGRKASPFAVDTSEIRVFARSAHSVVITDREGRVTGIAGDTIVTEIPGSAPLIASDGYGGQPYGYVAPAGSYSLALSGFRDSLARFTVATGGRTYSVERQGANAAETERYVYDGGISIANPDSAERVIAFESILRTSSDERVFRLGRITLSRGDSVKIDNPDEERLRIRSGEGGKVYDLELSVVNASHRAAFERRGVSIEAHASHLLVPDWGGLDGSELLLLVDRGDDGTVDDTLRLHDELTGALAPGLVSPSEFVLYQNYPNPFNPATMISYELPAASEVRLVVYDLLGREVAVLVNGTMEPGVHRVAFDASDLASGVYICRLQAGTFVQSRKLLLLR